jgi:hypothetical protein
VKEHHTLLALKEYRNLLLMQRANMTMALTFHRLPILGGSCSPLASYELSAYADRDGGGEGRKLRRGFTASSLVRLAQRVTLQTGGLQPEGPCSEPR